jgi:hypothetical protein
MDCLKMATGHPLNNSGTRHCRQPHAAATAAIETVSSLGHARKQLLMLLTLWTIR